MDRPPIDRVLDESVIEHNGKLYAWTIPIALPVEAELAGRLKAGPGSGLGQHGRRHRRHAGNQRRLSLDKLIPERASI